MITNIAIAMAPPSGGRYTVEVIISTYLFTMSDYYAAHALAPVHITSTSPVSEYLATKSPDNALLTINEFPKRSEVFLC